MKKKSWFRKKFIEPLIKFLKQGASPKKLASCIALGIVFGLIPFYGLTTGILTLLAFIFRLNHVIIQAAHYSVFWLQIILIPVFFKLGQIVFHQELIPFSFKQIKQMMESDMLGFLGNFGMATVYAIAVWAIISIPLYFGIYYSTLPYLRKLVVNIKKRRANQNEIV